MSREGENFGEESRVEGLVALAEFPVAEDCACSKSSETPGQLAGNKAALTARVEHGVSPSEGDGAPVAAGVTRGEGFLNMPRREFRF